MNRAIFAMLLVAAFSVDAQPASPRCDDAEFRAFDFWIGAWTVRDGAGQVLGYNAIKPVASGCGLLEQWRSTGSGVEAFSINAYDPTLARWTQRWVGPSTTLWLEGAIRDGAMVLTGTRPRTLQSGATALDRITWTPLPDGRVHQLWEMSLDGGEWQPYFDGYYSRGIAGGGLPSRRGGIQPRSFDF